LLCDLQAQPAEIKEKIQATIVAVKDNPKDISQVGIRLLKLCNTYDLVKISEQVQSYAEPLNARYA